MTADPMHAPPGKFRVTRVVAQKRRKAPIHKREGDYDTSSFAIQRALDIKRTAEIAGEADVAFVYDHAGVCLYSPFNAGSGVALNRRPIPVTSLAGLQREESRKPVTSHKRK